MRRQIPILFGFLPLALLVRCSGTPSTATGTPEEETPEEDADVVPEDASKKDGSVKADAQPPKDSEAPIDAPIVVCPSAGTTTVSGTIAASEISEASGLIVSSQNADTYWLHNDSGDSARVFAISNKGARRATINFDNKKPTDIEDMAIEDDGANSYLYFGDIGDNNSVRPGLTIHRISEPKLGAGDVTLTATSEKMSVTYVNGAHNAETLLFDPLTKDLLIVTKVPVGKAEVHRIGKFVAGGAATTTKIATLDVILATGGDISRDGRFIGIRNYTLSGALWVRGQGESIEQAFSRKPCKIPISLEQQGETLGFLPNGSGYVTVSEGASQDLHFTPLK